MTARWYGTLRREWGGPDHQSDGIRATCVPRNKQACCDSYVEHAIAMKGGRDAKTHDDIDVGTIKWLGTLQKEQGRFDAATWQDLASC